MDVSMSSIELNRQVNDVYKNMLYGFVPAVKVLQHQGNKLQRSLAHTSRRQSRYNQSLDKVHQSCAESLYLHDYASCLGQIGQFLTQIQKDHQETITWYFDQVLTPLQLNSKDDTNNIKDLWKQYRKGQQKIGAKMQKMSKISNDMGSLTSSMERLQMEGLSQAIREQRKRYAFVLNRHCDWLKQYKLMMLKAVNTLDEHLEHWSSVALMHQEDDRSTIAGREPQIIDSDMESIAAGRSVKRTNQSQQPKDQTIVHGNTVSNSQNIKFLYFKHKAFKNPQADSDADDQSTIVPSHRSRSNSSASDSTVSLPPDTTSLGTDGTATEVENTNQSTAAQNTSGIVLVKKTVTDPLIGVEQEQQQKPPGPKPKPQTPTIKRNESPVLLENGPQNREDENETPVKTLAVSQPDQHPSLRGRPQQLQGHYKHIQRELEHRFQQQNSNIVNGELVVRSRETSSISSFSSRSQSSRASSVVHKTQPQQPLAASPIANNVPPAPPLPEVVVLRTFKGRGTSSPRSATPTSENGLKPKSTFKETPPQRREVFSQMIQTPTPEQRTRPMSVISTMSESPGEEPTGEPQFVRASHAYAPSGKNQQPLAPGDIVRFIKEGKRGWAYGENVKTSRRGWFPLSHTVKLIETN